MNIGVLKETKRDENRVALQPCQVAQLRRHGHRVLVEVGAGRGSGYRDEEYVGFGAEVVSRRAVLDAGQLLLKVKVPLEREYDELSEQHTLFCYLHFDENIKAEAITRLVRRGFTGVAYEWVQTEDDLPLLSPMSRLTGYLFALKASELCMRYKGIVCGRYEPGLDGAKVLLIGLGRIGISALKFFADNHYRIAVVDKHPESIAQRFARRFDAGHSSPAALEGSIQEIVYFDNNEPLRAKNRLAEILPDFDMVINCAVRRVDLPKSRLDYLIDETMIRSLGQNSVVCDATACDKDLIETCLSTESLYEHEVIHGVIHYNCDHIPSYVGRTASDMLSNATFPYVLELADRGIVEAIRHNTPLRQGVCCHRGVLTHGLAAQKKNLPFSAIEELL